MAQITYIISCLVTTKFVSCRDLFGEEMGPSASRDQAQGASLEAN